MPKFNVGDKVVCKKGYLTVRSTKGEGMYGGAGYRSGKVFIINRITEEKTKNPIYWQVNHGQGVYEIALQLKRKRMYNTKIQEAKIQEAVEAAVAMIKGEYHA